MQDPPPMLVLGVLLKELSEKVLTMREKQAVEAIVSLLPPPQSPKIYEGGVRPWVFWRLGANFAGYLSTHFSSTEGTNSFV